MIHLTPSVAFVNMSVVSKFVFFSFTVLPEAGKKNPPLTDGFVFLSERWAEGDCPILDQEVAPIVLASIDVLMRKGVDVPAEVERG